MTKLLYNDPDAAIYRTDIKGWVNKKGQFYGEDEHLARWSACTHLICDCGNEHTKSYTMCDSCRDKKSLERYEAKEFKEWDGSTPLTIWGDDTYFFNEEDIIDYCDENEINGEDLNLMICEPNSPRELDSSWWEDTLPEDQELSDVCPELQKLLDAVNDYIRKEKPTFSWYMGKYRTSYNYNFINDKDA